MQCNFELVIKAKSIIQSKWSEEGPIVRKVRFLLIIKHNVLAINQILTYNLSADLPYQCHRSALHSSIKHEGNPSGRRHFSAIDFPFDSLTIRLIFSRAKLGSWWSCIAGVDQIHSTKKKSRKRERGGKLTQFIVGSMQETWMGLLIDELSIHPYNPSEPTSESNDPQPKNSQLLFLLQAFAFSFLPFFFFFFVNPFDLTTNANILPNCC